MSRGWNRFIDVKGVACLSHLENDLFQPRSFVERSFGHS